MSEKTINPTARVAKNSLVQLTGGLLGKIMGVLLIVYAARQLGASGFGVYSFVLSMLGIFYIFTDFGVGTLTTRDLAQRPEEEAKYLGNILSLRLILSLLAAIGMVACVAILGHPRQVVELTAIAALSLFFSSNVDTCSAVFYAHQRMEIPAMVSVVATVLRVGISLGALAVGADVYVLLWIYSAASALQFAMLYRMLVSRARPSFAFDWPFWKQLLRQAYPLALANLFSVVYFRIDTVMLASLAGAQAVGWYNAAYRLLEFTLIVPAYYGGAIFPVISASRHSNPQRFLLIYRRSMKYMLIASVPMALGVSALAPGIIEALYGGAYAGSVSVLSVLMWALVLICVNSINTPYLIVMGRQKTVTALIAVGMAVNIGLNFFAIPRFGIVGAAWVTFLSEVLTLTIFLLALRRDLDLRLKMLRHALPAMLAGGVMYWALLHVPGWDLGFQIILGAAVYIGLLFAFRAFDEVDQELFSRVLRPTWFGGIKLT